MKRYIAEYVGTFVLIHLVGIPVTNTSVNPARSIGPALFVAGWALGQFGCFSLPPSSCRCWRWEYT